MFRKTSTEARIPATRPLLRTAVEPVSDGTFSIFGADVSVTGDINATADLHIDGKVEGDITCVSLAQGESSMIVGTITSDNARLAGRVCGSISVGALVIRKTARIEGDIQYDTLAIEQGAQVDGRFSQRGATASGMALNNALTAASVSKEEPPMLPGASFAAA